MVDANGDGLPDWWELLYFGTLNLSTTSLDGYGNTLLYDYENNLDPNVVLFSIDVANNYVNLTNAPASLNIIGGAPSYYAVSVDDTNHASDASWQAYAGTNVTVNLGTNEGWHQIWIGLKGSGGGRDGDMVMDAVEAGLDSAATGRHRPDERHCHATHHPVDGLQREGVGRHQLRFEQRG